MDLLFFDTEPLFFDTPPAAEVVQLLQQAAENYGDELAEADLQRAYHLAPDHLMVLVALFRYYVYQQRFLEALAINQHAREVELANRSGRGVAVKAKSGSRVYMKMATAGAGLSFGLGGFASQLVILFQNSSEFAKFVAQGLDATAKVKLPKRQKAGDYQEPNYPFKWIPETY
jgi:hypothetical protein